MTYNCITLTTDIGWDYASQMKGVIYTIAPQMKIFDITHTITPQNIRQGAFILYSIIPYYPQAIHIGVIDPGVGTNRRSILVECNTGALIGPDNGVLIPAGQRMGIKNVYQLTNNKYFIGDSSTFQGRDIFSPVSAHLSQGINPADFGKKITDSVILNFEKSQKIPRGRKGKILYHDIFGNLITNIKHQELPLHFNTLLTLETPTHTYHPKFLQSYGHGEPHELLVTLSSFGFLEISCREGNARDMLGLKEDDTIILTQP